MFHAYILIVFVWLFRYIDLQYDMFTILSII